MKKNRPFVLYKQEDNGLLWMIPVSKAPKEKYEKVMSEGFKSIIKYSFVKTPSYILIQNIIPISYYHIRGRYLYNGIQVRITNKKICNTIGKQSKKIIAMITYDTYYFSSEIKYMYKKQLEYQKLKEQELELRENEDSDI
ncbi:MAG: hypothetical protein LUF02_08985 [Erysipelotrichaceae bacterium]|nr:hypothetical protein [Erysipelotrichaceae bacterium]